MQQATELRVRCSAAPHLAIESYLPETGTLILTWDTPLGCVNAPKQTRAPPRTHTLSLWWVFVFVALLYVGGGMWYNHQQYGATGWDLLPHRDAWREVPYYARDAVRHVTRAWSGSGAARSGYEAV